MMKHARWLILGCLALCLLWGSWAGAQAPTTMTYQGRLLTAAGAPVTAATSVVFRIYAAASGGSSVWTETRSVTPDANGVFTIDLGSTSALTTTVFDGTTRYLSLQVGADAEMTQRQALASVPYATRAATATTATSAPAPASIDGVVNNGGNIDLVPGAGLTITGNDAGNTITIAPAMGGMHPIAYGMITSTGTIFVAGSGNWTVSWNATSGGHEVAITGVTFHYAQYLAIVQGLSSVAKTFGVGSVSGHLLIYPRLHDGTVSQDYCSFMVYDLPGMKKSGEAASVPQAPAGMSDLEYMQSQR
jgi:hypothetical protein